MSRRGAIPDRNDAGRVPIGAILTVLILAGAGFGAYWFLGEYGFIDDGSGGADEAAGEAPGIVADGEEPEWLAGTGHDLPDVIDASGERPAMYELPDWIWEVNDQSWDLTVVREGEGDGQEALAERQNLVLVSPTDELFLVTDELRNDYLMSVVHWDAEQDVTWLRRGGRPGPTVVTELSLVTGEADTQWDNGAVAPVNNVDGDIVDVGYIGIQPDGLELWESASSGKYLTGVLWRDGDDFVRSLISARIERMAAQGFGDGAGVEAWIDVNGMRAVYHGTYDGDGEPEEQWLVHNLSDDSFAEASVDVPSVGCTPVDAVRRGAFDGDLIEAKCDGVTYLLDPYESGAPQAQE
ncbi:hypothetical protein [Demequina globuliformis]|uniref:hypothetical protein n=1 Tax=Demequina globuliformis TaxID=676202 RepID=UPI000AFC68A5|nr:hypothetical protein [Demequina globuliformis]